MTGHYDFRLVALSVLIAIFAAYAALDLAGRVASASRRAFGLWLAGGSLAMGSGVWAMHYVGMAAYRLPIPVAYDWPTVVISLLAAVFASAVALFAAGHPTMSRADWLVGGSVMGLGIAAMHYVGMRAMRLSAMCHYSGGLVALSIVLAVTISCTAIRVVYSLRDPVRTGSWRKLGGAVLLGIAIPVMHYVGMAAVTFTPMPEIQKSLKFAVSVSSLGLACIAMMTAMLLGIAVYSSAADRRVYFQTQLMANRRSQVQTIFDNLQEGIVVLDRDRRVVEMNRAAQRILCVTRPELFFSQAANTFDVYLRDGTRLPPDRWPSALALQGEFLQNCELELRRKDTGEVIITEIATAPVLDHAGELSHVIVSYRDITRPKQIDEARLRLASIVESSEDAIAATDLQGIVTSWNSGAERLFGYAAKEMIGQQIRSLLPIDRLHEEDEVFERVRRGLGVDHIETIRRRKNGQFIHVVLAVSPLRDSIGRITGASTIARNITDRKLMEGRLIESQKMEAIGQLTGGIAHDFNNLLSIVIGSLDLLERMVTDNPAALKRLLTARKAADRGADLTRRLLAFSRREQLRPVMTRLDEPIQTTLELAARALGPEIRITTHFDRSVPPVLVDVSSLESALLNLIVNARDAMPQGGDLTISTRIIVLNEESDPHLQSGLRYGRYASATISDTGGGMTRDTLDRAFEPFFTTKDRGKGTGMGLAMVYGFFKQSGGTVRIYSEFGYGTTVSFYLPLETDQPSTAAPAVTESHLSSGSTILLVDDEPDLAEIASAYLEEEGCTVLHAGAGAQALATLERHPEIDLLITDIIMPGGINGFELSRRALAIQPSLKVIYCSGFPADALADREEPPADAPLLLKPYQRSELICLVQQTLLRDSDLQSELSHESN